MVYRNKRWLTIAATILALMFVPVIAIALIQDFQVGNLVVVPLVVAMLYGVVLVWVNRVDIDDVGIYYRTLRRRRGMRWERIVKVPNPHVLVALLDGAGIPRPAPAL